MDECERENNPVPNPDWRRVPPPPLSHLDGKMSALINFYGVRSGKRQRPGLE